MVKRELKKSLDDEIGRIKVLARVECPYLYGLVKGVNIKVIEGNFLAYTDGRSVYMSEDFIRKRDVNHKIYIHEILHIALLHTVRAELISGVNRKVYNILGDHRINHMIQDKLGRIGMDGLVMDLRDYGFGQYLTQEEMEDYNKYNIDYLYSKLRSKQNDMESNGSISEYEGDIKDSDGDGEGEGKGKEGEGEPSSSGNSDKFNESEIRDMLNQGVLYGRSIGASKGSLEEWIENYCNKLVDWKKVIMNNTYALLEREADWSRLNKKSYLKDYSIMPRRRKKDGVKLLVGIDTSGSMDMKDISNFIGSLITLVKSYNAEIDIMEVDCVKQKVFNVKSKKDLEKVEIKGRGGTSYIPFIDYVKSNGVKLAVLFTDGYGDQSAISYKGNCKVFWIISNGGSVDNFNFGRVLEMR